VYSHTFFFKFICDFCYFVSAKASRGETLRRNISRVRNGKIMFLENLWILSKAATADEEEEMKERKKLSHIKYERGGRQRREISTNRPDFNKCREMAARKKPAISDTS
jgi:hypothetical protein